VCGENPTITELIDHEEFCGVPFPEKEATGPASGDGRQREKVPA